MLSPIKEEDDDEAQEVDVTEDDDEPPVLTKDTAVTKETGTKEIVTKESVTKEMHIKQEPADLEEDSLNDRELLPLNKVAKLSEREKGAFDVLLDMQVKQEVDSSVKAEEDDGIDVETLEVDSQTVDSGLEKDAALALLAMHQPAKVCGTEYIMQDAPLSFTPKHPIDAAREAQLAKAQYTMATEHNYSATGIAFDSDVTDSASEGDQDQVPILPPEILIDHNYCVTFFPDVARPPKRSRKRDKTKEVVNKDKISDVIECVIAQSREEYDTALEVEAALKIIEQEKKEEAKKKRKTKEKEKKEKKSKFKDVTNLNKVNRELVNLLPPDAVVKPKVELKPRSMQEEVQLTYDCLIRGIDQEDCVYLKQRYHDLLQQDSMQTYWLNDSHWVDHSHTLIPDPILPRKKRKHQHLHDDLPYKLHKTGTCPPT